MAEVDISKENQRRNKTKKLRSSMTFAELMAYSKVEAAQYLIDCGVNSKIMGMNPEDYIKKMRNSKGETIPEEKEKVREGVEVEKERKTSEETEEVEETQENGELSKEDLRELLDANNIEYRKTLGVKRLMDLATEKGLL